MGGAKATGGEAAQPRGASPARPVSSPLCRHPHIVRIYAFETATEGSAERGAAEAYLAMELLRGRDAGPAPEPAAAVACRGAAPSAR